MMAFDFDHAPDRRGTDSNKWTLLGHDVLPMWVADTDFAAPPAIVEALQQRVAQEVFGYGRDNAKLRAVLVERMAQLYGWSIEPTDVVFLPGLVSGLNAVSRAVGQPGDGVIVHTPVYGPFLSAPRYQGRTLHVAPLSVQVKGQQLHYSVDLERFEAAISDSTRLFILCNPHNPVGRTFGREELLAIAEVCERHNLVICSDEIHCDLLMGASRHIPMASLSPEIAQRTITLMSPSKTFNIPGLGFSMAIIQNTRLRKQFEAAGMGIVPHANILGIVAAEAAYTRCNDWLRELNAYLTANRDYAVAYLQSEVPTARVTCPEATYLLWLDCRELGVEGGPNDFFLKQFKVAVNDFFLKQARVAVNDGKSFGEGGEGFVRLNYGCPRAILQQGLEQMVGALRNGQ